MKIGELFTEMRVKTGPFTRGLAGAQKKFSSAARAITARSAAMATAVGARFRSLAGTISRQMQLAGLAIVGLSVVAIRAFGKQEAAEKGLEAALRMTGKASRETMDDMKEFASSIQEVTTLGDEAVLEMMTLGVTLGGLSGRELKDATKASIGLAERLGIDATSAMNLLSRAAQGNTSMLARYGIELDESLTPQEKFNEVLRLGADAFVLAEERADTTSGQIKRSWNALGDAMEKIGEGLIVTIGAMFGTNDLEGFTAYVKDTMIPAIEAAKPAFAAVGTFIGEVIERIVFAMKNLPETWDAVLTFLREATLNTMLEMQAGIADFFDTITLGVYSLVAETGDFKERGEFIRSFKGDSTIQGFRENLDTIRDEVAAEAARIAEKQRAEMIDALRQAGEPAPAIAGP